MGFFFVLTTTANMYIVRYLKRRLELVINKITWEGPFPPNGINQKGYYLAYIGMTNPLVIECLNETLFKSDTPWGFVCAQTLEIAQEEVQNLFVNFISKNANTYGQLEQFMTHAGVVDIETFEKWLERKYHETAILRKRLTPDSEIHDFVLGKDSATTEIYLNYRKATKQ